MEKFICIHGHFYQPPRENTWLEAVEQQDSAYPYHDWNERITEECYSPNATARILGDDKYIVSIINNYSKINFNFGPTLLSWLEERSPDVYQAILQADIDSQQRFKYGNAIAQAYNHMIMPLANDRDKYTQILWGIRDFEYRFKRKPLGMWLPETAVDLKVLDILAELGVEFTILAPRQAKRFRKMEDSAEWVEVSNGQIPPTMPYVQHLSSGRKITIFFYDGPVSQEIAFSTLLSQGEKFAQRIVQTIPENIDEPQLANIATDGETYGHHHSFGDMALAYALHYIESNNLAKITNYSQFMRLYPPTHEVEIIENSSWSCMHGVERWKSACGCNSGGHGEWNQEWRAPLRASLDWLRDLIAPLYETKVKEFLHDPWKARDLYINIILDRSDKSLEQFFKENSSRELSAQEKQTVLKLLEMQRHTMLMYTSCGWFFDELTGIETVQIISYAYRAIQLAESLFSTSIEENFLAQISAAKSNIAVYSDPRFIYENFIKPGIVSWHKIAANYAITSLFEDYENPTNIYCYNVHCEDYQKISQGSAKLVVGNGFFESNITKEKMQLCFVAMHFGDQNITCGVREVSNEGEYTEWIKNLIEIFDSGDLVAVTQLFVKCFDNSLYSISSLFRDKQSLVLNHILESTFEEMDAIYQQIYQRSNPLIHFIEDLNIALPKIFKITSKHVIDKELSIAFKKENFELEYIEKLLKEAAAAKIEMDEVSLGFTLQKILENMMRRFKNNAESSDELLHIIQAMKVISKLPFAINLYHIQNVFYQMLMTVYPEIKKRAEKGDELAKNWIKYFTELGAQLTVSI